MPVMYETGITWPDVYYNPANKELFVPLISFDPNTIPVLQRDTERGRQVGLQLGAALSRASIGETPALDYIEVKRTPFTDLLHDMRREANAGFVNPETVPKLAKYIYIHAVAPGTRPEA